MDRNIVYPGSIPLDSDVLSTNRDAMVGIAALTAATLGQRTVADGLACSPAFSENLSVTIGAGSITQLSSLDSMAYGSLGVDYADTIVKTGINLQATILDLVAPTQAGQAISYLIEAAFEEVDTDPVVLPYVNAANPAQPWSGPNNSGTAQYTKRTQRVQLQAKAGIPAATGTQQLPAVDAGWVGLYQVVVTCGQTFMMPSDITTLPEAPFIAYKLPVLRPGFSAMQVVTSSTTFTVPMGVTTMRVTAIGGGGGGGYHSTMSSGGGGAGGQVVSILSGLTPGQEIPVTIGHGGAVLTAFGNGNNGGATVVSGYLTAGGGVGGNGGTQTGYGNAGGPGGSAVGGLLNMNGSYGTDSIQVASRGGDGGGPGNGRGTTGPLPGLSAVSYGGGGGGGGCSIVGTAEGYPGGAGAPGVVVFEY